MVKSEIAAYMEKAFLFQYGDEITDTTDLFKAGIIDSHGYIQLMQHIQGAYRIKLSRDELLSSVITSLSGIATLVEAKLSAGGPVGK